MGFLERLVGGSLFLLVGTVFSLSLRFFQSSDASTTIGQAHVHAAPIHRHFSKPQANDGWLRGSYIFCRALLPRSPYYTSGADSFRAAAERSVAIRKYLAEQRCDLDHSDSSRIFSEIYKMGMWSPGSLLSLSDLTPRMFYNYGDPFGTSKRPSLSGVGSVVGEATKSSIEFLSSVITEFGITSVLDIPCGDANWQFEAFEMDVLPIYVGADIVPELVALNQRRFAHHMNKHFVAWDFAKCPLPTLPFQGDHMTATRSAGHPQPFDLVHARDVFQHMPLERAVQAAAHIRESGCRFAVVTTWPKSKNERISEGSFYFNNMQEHPFNYPAPIKCVRTHPHLEEDLTCLYAFGATS